MAEQEWVGIYTSDSAGKPVALVAADGPVREVRRAFAGQHIHIAAVDFTATENADIKALLAPPAVEEPAVEQARLAGIDASDPLPADTLFGKAARGAYDGVVALYHDQGLIPLKLVAFGTCVNMTVGLPIIRTSVDHGTAYDIAGRGVAEPGSLIAAIKLAVQLVHIRRQAARVGSRGPLREPQMTGKR